jgi:hypothetical protein
MPTPSAIRKDLLTARIPSPRAVARVEVKEVTMGPGQAEHELIRTLSR